MDAPESALLAYPPSREAGEAWAWGAPAPKLPSVSAWEWGLPLGRVSPLRLVSPLGLTLPQQSEPSPHPRVTTTDTPPAATAATLATQSQEVSRYPYPSRTALPFWLHSAQVDGRYRPALMVASHFRDSGPPAPIARRQWADLGLRALRWNEARRPVNGPAKRQAESLPCTNRYAGATSTSEKLTPRLHPLHHTARPRQRLKVAGRRISRPSRVPTETRKAAR